MNLKLFALAACFLIGSACAQTDQDYYGLCTGLTEIGSSMDSTDRVSLPRLDVSLQQLIDDASDGSSILIPSGGYDLSEPLHEPLHISKSITFTKLL